MTRPVLVLLAAVLLPGALSGPASASASAPALAPASLRTPVSESVSGSVPGSARYRAPVEGPLRVVNAFDPPATPYGPGHLGVDLAVEPGAPVRAAGAGVVSFAGSVAGRGVVVLAHPDGLSTEYEPITPTVRVGSIVPVGTVLGHLTGSHHGCTPARCLHWGARRGAVYLDPLSLLARLGVVRLVPWDWTPGLPLN